MPTMPPQQTEMPASCTCCKVVQAIVVGARGDDLGIVSARGVEVVVVGGEAGVLESSGLVGGKHSQRDARFHAEVAHFANHFQDGVELGPVLWASPGGAHAEARCAAIASLVSAATLTSATPIKRLAFNRRLVVGALRTIAAILGAAAGLDAQQATLHIAGSRLAR